MQATAPRIAPVFVCCLFIRMFVSAEDGTQGLGHAKQLFHLIFLEDKIQDALIQI